MKYKVFGASKNIYCWQ